MPKFVWRKQDITITPPAKGLAERLSPFVRALYSPDQPRDDQGQWTAGGTGGSNEHTTERKETTQPAGARAPTENSNRLAKEIHDKALKEEMVTTPILTRVAAQHGGQMVGLDFRIKTESSLSGKIAGEARDKGTTEEAEAAYIGDALRYTATFPPERYANGVQAIEQALEAEGFKQVKDKNYWHTIDPTYHGINTNWQTPGGMKIELQFHTPDSFAIKEHENHADYEVWRNGKSTPEGRSAYSRMVARWARVVVPTGALALHEPA